MGGWQPLVASIPGFEKQARWSVLPTHCNVEAILFEDTFKAFLANFMTPAEVQLVTVLLNLLQVHRLFRDPL